MLGHPSSEKVTWLKVDPDFERGEALMEFRLTYEGQLLGASRSNTRAEHKHEIRKVFHRQIRQLWTIYPHLNATIDVLDPIAAYHAAVAAGERGEKTPPKYERMVDWLARNYTRCNYRFVPLVTREMNLTCGINVLFLRPESPGRVLKSGDIDNRLKTLFDALRIVHDADELGRYKAPGDDEDPFFCLLEDDSLIDHLSVETDRLLQPIGEQFEVNDARLVITVNIRPTLQTSANIRFN